MNPKAEQAAKNQLISEIQLRYEALTDGLLIEGDRLESIKALPLGYLEQLLRELNEADPEKTKADNLASGIVVKIIHEHKAACRAAEEQRDRGMPASTSMGL